MKKSPKFTHSPNNCIGLKTQAWSRRNHALPKTVVVVRVLESHGGLLGPPLCAPTRYFVLFPSPTCIKFSKFMWEAMIWYWILVATKSIPLCRKIEAPNLFLVIGNPPLFTLTFAPTFWVRNLDEASQFQIGNTRIIIGAFFLSLLKRGVLI